MRGIQMPFSGPLVQFHHKTIDLSPLWGAKSWTKQLPKGLCQAGNELLIRLWKGTALETGLFIIYINELEDDLVNKIPSLENATFWSATTSRETMKSKKCKIQTNMSLNKERKEGIFPEQERAKAGCQVITEIPYCQFVWEWSSVLGRKKKCLDCLLDRHNTMHLSKEAALSLLQMCAQYTMPFISYLGWTVNYSNTISYSTPQRDSASSQLDWQRHVCVCASFLWASLMLAVLPLLQTEPAFSIHNLPPCIRNGFLFNPLFLPSSHVVYIFLTVSPGLAMPELIRAFPGNLTFSWDKRRGNILPYCIRSSLQLAFLFCWVALCPVLHLFIFGHLFSSVLLPFTEQLPPSYSVYKHLWPLGYWLFIRLLVHYLTFTFPAPFCSDFSLPSLFGPDPLHAMISTTCIISTKIPYFAGLPSLLSPLGLGMIGTSEWRHYRYFSLYNSVWFFSNKALGQFEER